MSMSARPLSAADPHHFRSVLSHFASGVTIVAAVNDGAPVGLTCQSFFSLSLDPPLVAFSAAKTSTSYPRIRAAGSFCINILAGDQQELCAGFARSQTDKWRGVSWAPGPTGSPVIDGVLAWIDCEIHAEHEAGDHFLTIGRVVALHRNDHPQPLVFYRGGFVRVSDPAAVA